MAGIKKKIDLYCGRPFKIGPTVFSGTFTGIILDEEAIRIALNNKAQVKEVLRNGKRAPLDYSNYYKKNPMGYDVDNQLVEGDPSTLQNVIRTIKPTTSNIQANQPPVSNQIGTAKPTTIADVEAANDYTATITTPREVVNSNNLATSVGGNTVINAITANTTNEKKTNIEPLAKSEVKPTTSYGPSVIKSEPREYTTNTGVLETVKKPEPNTIKALNTTIITDTSAANSTFKLQSSSTVIKALNVSKSDDDKFKSKEKEEDKKSEEETE